MRTEPKIAILLSTYNGSKYLIEQLDSILDQSYLNYVIVARDDDSCDDSLKILDAVSYTHLTLPTNREV